jgi:mRNA-degrading endonuclease RelE of RelBE toxin-antitoxin system
MRRARGPSQHGAGNPKIIVLPRGTRIDDPGIRKRIDAKLTIYATNGWGDVKRLKGRGSCRLRVGDWRVVFIEENTAIIIIAVGNRREIYNWEATIMNVRFKKTGKGEIAILPRKEYEALAAKAAEADDDIGSARLVARARKEIAAGAPLIPKKIVDRIANGENPLRVLREWRDMTQLELSFKTDIGQGYISDLESRRRKGTTAALKRIAGAMNVPLDLLVWVGRHHCHTIAI